MFSKYGELKNAGRLANAVCQARSSRIKTTGQFVEAIQDCIPAHGQQKYLAKVFQALRIEVNDELESLKHMLEQTIRFMNRGGRMVILSYHSLEDRLVKNFMKRGSFTGEIEKDFYGNVLKPFTEIVRHPIIPSDEEIFAIVCYSCSLSIDK